MSSGFIHSAKKSKGKNKASKHVYSGLANIQYPFPIDEVPPKDDVFDPNDRRTDWPDDTDSDRRTRDDSRDTDDDGSGHRYPGRGGDDDPTGGDRDGDDRGDTDHPNDDGGNDCTGVLGCRDDDGDSGGNGNGNGGSDDDGNGNGDGGSNDGGTQMPVGVDLSAMKAFYNDNKVAVWSGGGVLALLLLLK